MCQKHVATMRLSPTSHKNKRANTYILPTPFTLGYHPRTLLPITPAGQNTEQLLFFIPLSTLRNRRARSNTAAVASRSIPQVHRQDQRRRQEGAVEDGVGKVPRCLNDLMSKELKVDILLLLLLAMLFVLFPDALGLRTGFCGCP